MTMRKNTSNIDLTRSVYKTIHIVEMPKHRGMMQKRTNNIRHRVHNHASSAGSAAPPKFREPHTLQKHCARKLTPSKCTIFASCCCKPEHKKTAQILLRHTQPILLKQTNATIIYSRSRTCLNTLATVNKEKFDDGGKISGKKKTLHQQQQLGVQEEGTSNNHA